MFIFSIKHYQKIKERKKERSILNEHIITYLQLHE